MSNNHVIDPTFFDSAIEEFAFDYDWYANNGRTIDEEGRRVNTFEKRTIRGSLQSKGTTITQSKTGNTQEWRYNFYCKSLYRIKDGDFIFYKDKWLRVDSFHDYDEWGVRSCSLIMVQLSACKDLKEYLKYIKGEESV